MNKRVKTIKILSSKRNTNYEIRKEHVTFTDGTTMDRIICYSFTGKPLGSIKETERLFRIQGTGPMISKESNYPVINKIKKEKK